MRGYSLPILPSWLVLLVKKEGISLMFYRIISNYKFGCHPVLCVKVSAKQADEDVRWARPVPLIWQGNYSALPFKLPSQSGRLKGDESKENSYPGLRTALAIYLE